MYTFHEESKEKLPRIEDLPRIVEMMLQRYKAAVTIVDNEGLTPFDITIEEEILKYSKFFLVR